MLLKKIIINKLLRIIKKINNYLFNIDFSEVYLWQAEIIRRIDPKHISALQKKIRVMDINDNNLLHNISTEGIVFVESFLGEKEINFVFNVLTSLNLNGYGEIDDFERDFKDYVLVVGKSNNFKSYQSLTNFVKPVVTVRKGVDEGMIDMWLQLRMQQRWRRRLERERNRQ